jgi:hypothetical protein
MTQDRVTSGKFSIRNEGLSIVDKFNHKLLNHQNPKPMVANFTKVNELNQKLRSNRKIKSILTQRPEKLVKVIQVDEV